MATLEFSPGRTIRLRHQTLVGRADTCHVVVQDRRVSGEHAVVTWDGGAWVVRDLGSRNGTAVEGQRIGAGASLPLHARAALMVGDTELKLVDAGPPVPFAQDTDTQLEQVTGPDLIELPGEPPASISEWPDGWWMEVDTHRVRVRDLAIVTHGGQTWRLHLPQEHDGTWQGHAAPALDQVAMAFRVSPDEDHAEIDLLLGDRTLALGSRAHHDLLLTLARHRLDQADLPPSEQGWIDTDALQKTLRMADATLYTQIHRARAALSRGGVLGAAGVVERRAGARQLRLGVSRLEVQGP